MYFDGNAFSRTGRYDETCYVVSARYRVFGTTLAPRLNQSYVSAVLLQNLIAI